MSDLPSPFNRPDQSEVYTTPKDVLAYVVREMDAAGAITAKP